MKSILRGIYRVIKLLTATIRETVFTIPTRVIKRIGGEPTEYTFNTFTMELLKLWLLMLVCSLLALPAILGNILAYLFLAAIGEYIYVICTSGSFDLELEIEATSN